MERPFTPNMARRRFYRDTLEFLQQQIEMHKASYDHCDTEMMSIDLDLYNGHEQHMQLNQKLEEFGRKIEMLVYLKELAETDNPFYDELPVKKRRRKN